MSNSAAITKKPATIVVAAGRPEKVAGAPLNPPLVLSSTYVSQGIPGPENLYARINTETWESFEEIIAELEAAKLPGLVFSSGLAAIAAALSLMPDNGVLVIPQHAYQMGLLLISQEASKHNWEVRKVDIADTDQVIAAMSGKGYENRAVANVILIESPTNPMLEIADLPALLAAAKQLGVRSIVDNTFATPLGQQPLRFGAAIVLHSATKYLAGHSDVILGVIVTNDPQLRAMLHDYRSQHGAVPGPFEVWLAIRGVRTLALRLERAQNNAAELARRLAAHPGVAQVRHPSLPNDPGYARASAQMNGYGAIIGLRPRAVNRSPAEAADAVVAAVNLWVPATSLGGVESTLERRRRFPTESNTVPEDLIRLSVGIEDVEDLWNDLDQALNAAILAEQ